MCPFCSRNGPVWPLGQTCGPQLLFTRPHSIFFTVFYFGEKKTHNSSPLMGCFETYWTTVSWMKPYKLRGVVPPFSHIFICFVLFFLMLENLWTVLLG